MRLPGRLSGALAGVTGAIDRVVPAAWRQAEGPGWLRNLPRWGGYFAFGLFAFVLVLYLSLPFARVREQLEVEAAARGYELTIGHLGPAFPLGLSASDVKVRVAATTLPAPSFGLALDRIAARVGPLGLIIARPSVTVRLEGLGGDLVLSWDHGPTVDVEVEAAGLNLGQIRGLEHFTKVPLGGVLGLTGELSLPGQKLATAEGELELSLADFTIGDGKSKLTVPGDPFLSQGLTLPRMRLGSPQGHIKIEKGTAKIPPIDGHSPDMDIRLEGEVTLRDPIGMSTASLCFLFRPSDALVKREAVFEILTTSLSGAAKRPDGFYGLRISGRFDVLRAVPGRCGNPNGPAVTPAQAAASPTPQAAPRPAEQRFDGDGLGTAPIPAQPAPVAPPPPPPPPSGRIEDDGDDEIEARRAAERDRMAPPVPPIPPPSANPPLPPQQPPMDDPVVPPPVPVDPHGNVPGMPPNGEIEPGPGDVPDQAELPPQQGPGQNNPSSEDE